ncbi:MAG: hypothetical protein IJU33_07255 [Bacteroidales bacterium]|nr:hypothetical protein [Bacteroidales bacterium]
MLLNKEKVDLVVFDINGKKVAEYHNTLPSGEHQFRATMSTPQTYLLSAVTKNGNTSIKMINLSNTGEQARIEYISSLPLSVDMTKKHTNYEFGSGDNMQYVGYTTQNTGVKEATLTQIQQGSEEITFTFPTETFDPIVNVTTDSAGSIEMTTATLFGRYTVQHTTAKEAGFEYKKTADGEFASILASNTNAAFTANLRGLEAGTEYTFRAFVTTNEDSTVYGEEKTFTTEQVKETTVITGEATDINKRGATLHGSFVIGNEELMGLGMDLKSKDGTGDFKDWENVGFSLPNANPFEIKVENLLEPGTTYLYRATATTKDGSKTIYGEEKEFTTQEVSPEMPEVETGRAITNTYDEKAAQLTGKVISTGYCTMSEIGFYVGTTENPSKDGEKLAAADPAATDFNCVTETMAPATTYYYVAFATNEVGTAYGEVKSFKTREAKALPEVVTKKVDAYSTSAEVACEVVSSGETLTERGICYSTTANPDTNATKMAYNTAAVGAYTMTMGELTENTKYYVRAYATSWAGIAYGDVIEFSTVSLTIPEVETKEVVKVGGGSATILSKLTVMGGSANLTVGVVCNDTVAEPTLENGYVFVGDAIADDSTYTTLALKLNKETKYYVRAYATNEAGTAYGNVLEFTTTAGFACGDEIFDVENNAYKTVQIGKQCWMAEDLRATSYADGTKLDGNATTAAGSLTNGRYYYEINDEVLGHAILYHWSSAANRSTANLDQEAYIQGICPDGWHLPSYREWAVMFKAIDPEYDGGAEYATTAIDVPSNDKLAVRLASPEGYWNTWSQTGTGGNGRVGDITYSTTANSPGYLKGNNMLDDPAWNSSGFNIKPVGYWDRKIAKWYANGTGYFWTSISNGAYNYSNFISISQLRVGARHGSYSDVGRDYYSVRCIKDADPTEPEVKTNPVGTVTASTAVINGEVTFNGRAAITEKGFYYSDDKDSVLTTGTKVVSEDAATTFSATLTELDALTTYYYAAYAVNEVGTGFGEVDSFTTNQEAVMATIETKNFSNVYATSLSVTGEVVDDGGEVVSERGICWNTATEPTIENYKKADTKTGEGEFTVDIDSLQGSTQYYFRAYAVTLKGVAYGNEIDTIMPEAKVPTVQLDSVYSVGKRTANVDAQILDAGNQIVTASGIVFDTIAEPTIERGTVMESGMTEGTFTIKVKGLTENTKYYVRAFAVNSTGAGYSEEMTFQTDTAAGAFKKCGDKLTDVDGNEYATVKIGGQCWMQENLRTKTMPDGTEMIPWHSNLTTDELIKNRYYAEYENDVMGNQIFYPWATATDAIANVSQRNQDSIIQGVCPDGWHMPSPNEYAELFEFVDPEWTRYNGIWASTSNSGNAGTTKLSNNKLGIKLGLKEGHWCGYAGPGLVNMNSTTYANVGSPGYAWTLDPEETAWNESGFSALPCGYMVKNKAASTSYDQCWYFNGTLNLWTSVAGTGVSSYANAVKISCYETGVPLYTWSDEGRSGYSVRCLLDPAPEEPTVTAEEATTVTASKATIAGRVVHNGRRDITEKGFMFGTTENVIAEGTKLVMNTEGDRFDTTFNELPSKTTFYYAAFATNEVGTGYSDVKTFTTQNDAVLATVETKEATNLLATSVTILSEVVRDGGELVTERGLCYATTENPDTTATVIKDSKAEVGEFTTDIADLTSGTTYHFRAYAVTLMGVAYGNDLVVNVPEAKLPVVTTDSVGNVGAGSAVVYATITDNGNLDIIERGVVVDTLENPTIDSKLALSNDKTDSYATNVTGLKKVTTYFVRAYVKNSVGVAYGDNVEFTTAEGFACGTPIQDVEGNSYRTVQIGEQCWMKDNMRVKKYPDGTPLQEWTTSLRDQGAKIYGVVSDPTIGGEQVLYSWRGATNLDAANTDQELKVQGICPDGWHVPSYRDCATLLKFVDNDWDAGSETVYTNRGNVGNTAKSNNQQSIKLCAKDAVWEAYSGPGIGAVTATSHTNPNSPGYAYANNPDDPQWQWDIYGFEARPAGYIIKDKTYTVPAGQSPAQVHWWNNGTMNMWTSISNSSASSGYAQCIKFSCYETGVPHYMYSNEVKSCYTVRCLWNGEEEPETPDTPDEPTTCTAHVMFDGEGWSRSNSASLNTDDKPYHVQASAEPFDKEITFSEFTLTITNLDKDATMGEQCHFIIDGIDGVEPFMSEQHVDELVKADQIIISYKCGDAKLTIDYK